MLVEALRDDLLQLSDVLAAGIDLFNQRKRKCPVGRTGTEGPWRSGSFQSETGSVFPH
jgi:hypothetical protein